MALTINIYVKEEDREGLNVTMKMVDAAIEFACHKSGDRLALFMAEKGTYFSIKMIRCLFVC